MPNPKKKPGQPWTQEQLDVVEAAIRRGYEPLRCAEPLTLWEWADEHFHLSPESSSVEGPWVSLPYQRGIMGAISNDDIEVVTWQKCKRVGYTKILTAAVGYFASFLRRSTVVYQPTETDAEDYVTEQIDPMLRDVKPVRSALLVDPEKSKSKHNKKDQKAFVGTLLHIRGGKSGRAYRMLTKDVVIYDELSAFDHDIDGEGSAVSLGDGRLETSCFPKSIRGSTPKIRGICEIEKSVNEADLIFWRFVRCVGCRSLHRLEWSCMVFDSSDVAAGVHHACPRCGYAATYAELPDMDAHGEWRTLAETAQHPEPGAHRIDDEGVVLHVDSGDRVDVRHVAFRIWSAYSYFRPWVGIAREFVAASRKAKSGDTAALKTWTNTVAAETWEQTALEADESNLFIRREHYTADAMPSAVLALTAGVDVQGDRIEACVYGWGRGEESWHIERVQIWCDPSQPKFWEDDLESFLLRDRRTVDGRVLPVLATGVDTGHHTDAAYRFCRPRWRRRVFAIKGRGVERDRPIIGAPTIIKGKGIRLFTVGSYNAKVLILQRLNLSVPGPGYCHLSLAFDAEYCEQLTAEKLVSRLSRGREIREFVERRRRNEGLDMLQYGLAALYLLNPRELYEDARPVETAETPSPESPSRAAPVQGLARRPARKNPTTRW